MKFKYLIINVLDNSWITNTQRIRNISISYKNDNFFVKMTEIKNKFAIYAKYHRKLSRVRVDEPLLVDIYFYDIV